MFFIPLFKNPSCFKVKFLTTLILTYLILFFTIGHALNFTIFFYSTPLLNLCSNSFLHLCVQLPQVLYHDFFELFINYLVFFISLIKSIPFFLTLIVFIGEVICPSDQLS